MRDSPSLRVRPLARGAWRRHGQAIIDRLPEYECARLARLIAECLPLARDYVEDLGYPRCAVGGLIATATWVEHA